MIIEFSDGGFYIHIWRITIYTKTHTTKTDTIKGLLTEHIPSLLYSAWRH